jgi:beta-lactamase regulating signal transducer with metallopeptidase domain
VLVWALDSLIATTLLMLLVLALRAPVVRFLGARWAYALWLTLLAPLFISLLSTGEESFLSFILPYAASIPAAAGGSAASSPSLGGSLQVPVCMIWAGGAAVFLSRRWLAYRHLRSSLERGMRRSSVESARGVPVFESEAAKAPLAFGMFKRMIAVPPLFEYRYTPVDQQLALERERIRHERGDFFWLAAASFVLAANWFNPLAHAAFRAFCADQALACDAVLVGRLPRMMKPAGNSPHDGLVAVCADSKPEGPRNMVLREGGGASALPLAG